MADPTQWGIQTNMPWREWILFERRNYYRKATLHADGQIQYSAANTKADWTDVHIDFSYLGKDRIGGAYDSFYPFFKPLDNDFCDEDELQTLHTAGVRFILAVQENTNGFTSFSGEVSFITNSKEIDWRKITGKHYDGSNDWDSYPPPDYAEGALIAIPGQIVANPQIADLPLEYHAYFKSKAASGNVLFNRFAGNDHAIYQDDMFRNGFHAEMANTTPVIAVGDRLLVTFYPVAVKIYYLNACALELSRRSMPTVGGVPLTISGLGFRIPDANLQPYDHVAAVYDHKTTHVHFIGREGQGTYTLAWNNGLPPSDYDLSNTAIEIPSMPAMAKGTYWIKFEQQDDQRGGVASKYYSYAGDWRPGDSGRIYPGSRIVFAVYDSKIPKEPIQPFFEWGWKWGDLLIKEHYAPIDTRATATFWDGRIMNLSSVTQAIDDKTGLFNISDIDVTLANQDKHFSTLLANYFCKGQVAALAHGFGEEPEAWHESIVYGMVDDYSLKGPDFNARLKNYAQKFLKGKLPFYIITRDEYPDCLDAAVGQPIPELVGKHYFASGSAPGAIQAHCVDTVNHRYILSRGPLHAVTEVYSDGVFVAAANYVVWFDADGRQYIDFNADQGDNKITFNCEGYMFADWNSANGYIQNPAYVIAFYWAMLCEIPINFLDLDAINNLADQFDDAGDGESGKLYIVSMEDKAAILQKLLYCFGSKYWQRRSGRVTLARKDIANISSDLFIHAQIESMDSPDRRFNLEAAVNSVKANFDHYPAADLYGGAIEESDESSIDRFGEEYQESWDFPFITTEAFCTKRVIEDLYKIAYGDKYIEFSLPIEMIGDIDIFDDFRLQDPFGLSSTGSGEISREYYVTSLTYDYQNASIKVKARDLQYLLQQYFIFGDEDEMPDLWENASDYYRLYGYLCDEDTFTFSDGLRGKILIDEGFLDQD